MEVTRARYHYGHAQKQPKSWRRRGSQLMAAICLLAILSYCMLAYYKPVDASAGELAELQAYQPVQVPITWPTRGQAAIGDSKAGLLARANETETRQPIASITKVVTALVVLDKQPLAPGEQGPVYTIGQADIDSYHAYVAKLGSVMPINNGQQISLYQALQGIMLPSANNVADSLARWTFGSMDAYLAAAADYLVSHQLADTVIADASGFSPGSMSTPSDLIKIGQLALAHPVLAEIMATREAVIPGTGTIRNTNFLLNDSQSIGIKTGTTDEAGYCLLFAVRHGPEDGHILIGAVLGQSSWAELQAQVRSVRDQAIAGHKLVQVAPAGTIVGTYTTAWGQSAEAVTLDDVSVYAWTAATPMLRAQLDTAEAPLQAGTVIGNAWVESNTSVQTKVVLRQGIEPPNLFWRLRNYF